MATSCPPGMSWDTLVKACVSEEKTPDTGPVKGEGCAAGLFWDSLVRQCMKAQKNLTTEAAPVLEASAETPPGAGAPVVSPLAWGCVLGVMCSSLLALLLWFIIYRKYRRQHARTPGPGARGAASWGRCSSHCAANTVLTPQQEALTSDLRK